MSNGATGQLFRCLAHLRLLYQLIVVKRLLSTKADVNTELAYNFLHYPLCETSIGMVEIPSFLIIFH
jgi:hypothetical protein